MSTAPTLSQPSTEAGAQSAIEFTMKAMALNYSPKHSWDHLDAQACLEAAKEITRLRAAPASVEAPTGTQAAVAPEPWIDVKDRLPTHLYSVLGVVVDGPMVVEGDPDDRMRDVVSYDPEEGHWHQYVGGDSLSARVTVTHWQDLPDLP